MGQRNHPQHGFLRGPDPCYGADQDGGIASTQEVASGDGYLHMAGLPHVQSERGDNQVRQAACSGAVGWLDDAVWFWLRRYAARDARLQKVISETSERSAAVLPRGRLAHRGNERSPGPHS